MRVWTFRSGLKVYFGLTVFIKRSCEREGSVYTAHSKGYENFGPHGWNGIMEMNFDEHDEGTLGRDGRLCRNWKAGVSGIVRDLF